MNLKLLLLAFTCHIFPQSNYFKFVFFSTVKVIQIQISLYAFFVTKVNLLQHLFPSHLTASLLVHCDCSILQGAGHLNRVLGVLMDPESLQVNKTSGTNLQ